MEPLKRLSLAAFLLIALPGCGPALVVLRGGLQPPALHLQTTAPSAASAEGITLSATFRVENPNPVPLTFGGASISYLLESKKLFSAEVLNKVELPASATSTLVLPIRVAYSAIPELAARSEQADTVPYEIESTLTFRTSVGDLGLPVKWSGALPLPKAPRVSFTALHVDQLSFGTAHVVLSVAVENPNTFDEAFERLNGRLMVEEKVVGTVAVEARHAAGAHNKTEVLIPLDLATAGTTISEALQRSAAVFHFSGSARVDGAEVPVEGNAGLK